MSCHDEYLRLALLRAEERKVGRMVGRIDETVNLL